MQDQEWVALFNGPMKKIKNVANCQDCFSEVELQLLREKISLTDIDKEKISTFFVLRSFYEETLEKAEFNIVGLNNITYWLASIEVLSYMILLNESREIFRFLEACFSYYSSLVNKLFAYFLKDEDKDIFARSVSGHKEMILKEFKS